MDIAIAGGHGQIALRLTRLLRERGDSVRSLIRNPDHSDDVQDAGGEPVVCDLEQASDEEVAEAVGSVDAVVSRYVLVSAISADASAEGDDTYTIYRRAKGRADAELEASGLEYTIVRPGSLTDDPGTGRVDVAEHLEGGSISRDDVAAVVAEALHDPRAPTALFYVVSGETPIDRAIASL